MAEEVRNQDAQDQEQPGLPDYESETTEQLEARLAAGEGLIVTRDDEDQTPEPEPAEAEPEPQEAAEEAPEPEPEPEEQPNYELEELRLQLEKSEQERKRMEFLSGRHAGELGYLKKTIRELQEQSRTAPRETDDTDSYETAPRQQYAPRETVDPVLQARLAELEDDNRRTIMESEYEDFLSSNGLLYPNGNGEDSEARRAEIQATLDAMAPKVKEAMTPYAEISLAGKSLRKVMRMALDSAYTDVKLETLRKARAEAKQKKVTQVAERNLAKQAAAISGSGGAPPPKPKPKRPEEMTAEEADAELIRLFGDGHYRRPNRRL